VTTFGLVAIVKNEADSIAACIESARPLISAWTILDTGSTDGTQDVVRASLEDLPGTLYEGDWQGFGPARTRVLELGRELEVDYLLMLDADHRLVIEGDLPEILDKDSYLIRVRAPMSWKLPLITRAAHQWDYRGAAHSFLHSDARTTVGDLSDVLSIEPGPAPSREKLAGDMPLLEREVAKDPTNARATYYLAQTYRDLDMPVEAAGMFRRRVSMTHGFDEERYWACYQLGLLMAQADWEKAISVLLEAWQLRPNRVEALWVLARGFHQHGDLFLANHFAEIGSKIPPSTDKLFVLTQFQKPEAWTPFLAQKEAA
jgi:tetratricopeptide (TPR) repeat protein